MRKILELEMNIPSTKSHAIFTIAVEYKTKDNRSVYSLIRTSGEMDLVIGSMPTAQTYRSPELSTITLEPGPGICNNWRYGRRVHANWYLIT